MLRHSRRSRRAWLRRLGLTLATASLAQASGGKPSRAEELPSFVSPRDQWDAAPAGAGMRPHAIERITVHHTGPPAWYGTPAAPAYLRQIQAFHQGPERGWPDIAYHLLIDLDGAVWEGRPLAFAGDSATSYEPAGHALIALIGDYDVQHVNAAQADALLATVRFLLDSHGIPASAIGGHRDYAATACPGQDLYALLDSIRAAV